MFNNPLLSAKEASSLTGFSPQELNQHHKFNRIRRYGRKFNAWEAIQLKLFILANTKEGKYLDWSLFLDPSRQREIEIQRLTRSIKRDVAKLKLITGQK